jgi:glycosyltransferase 2 family protein
LLNGLYRGPSRHSESYRRTGEVLLVGYSVNNLLPARLGELFRADYAGKRLALNSTTVFGTIVIERLLDGVMVATALCGGLLMLFATGGDLAAGYREPLAVIAVGGGAMISAAVAAVWAAIRYPRLLDWLPGFGRRLSGDLVQGLGCIRQSDMGRVVAMTLLIWLLEGAAIWSLVYSAGITLGWWESVVLVGALSLGTLVPTAPAYVGSYQLIFGLCLAAFGLPAAVGVLGASMVQVFLLGPVTIAGLLVYSALQVSAVVRVADG